MPCRPGAVLDRARAGGVASIAVGRSYNPFQPGFTENPYPHLQEMRESDPVHLSPMGAWVLFRYEDVFRMLRDPTLSVEDRNVKPTPAMELAMEVMGDVADMGNRSMLNRDPPDHTRLRRLVSKAFTPRRVEELRPRIENLVDEALDAATPRWDLVDGLAFPLPFQVISELLGTPDTDSAQLRQWSGTVVRSLEPVVDPETVKAIAEAAVNIRDLISDIVAWKKANPADDLLTALILAEEDGDKLSPYELSEQIALLYLAGHETTVNLIGNGTLALLRHPDQLERLRHDPAIAANAVEEMLRYDSPVQNSRRITLAPIQVGAKRIDARSLVVLSLASANRDAARWGTSADRLDVSRQGASQHVSFGGGHHYCLGSYLARLEAEVAITRLVRRFPGLALGGEPQWNGRLNLRGLSHLPVLTA
ncbi:MAG TPA: cytochrome P450 [Acidimicrobiales bacterium]|nr:cytochrome P450 [Acidimicrobiales bacterium]